MYIITNIRKYYVQIHGKAICSQCPMRVSIYECACAILFGSFIIIRWFRVLLIYFCRSQIIIISSLFQIIPIIVIAPDGFGSNGPFYSICVVLSYFLLSVQGVIAFICLFFGLYSYTYI